MRFVRVFSAVTALCVLGFSGCGEATSETAETSGIVTVNGAPMAGLNVTFTPEKGRPGSGTTDASGVFVITTDAPNDGAVPGKHKVSVTPGGGSAPPPMPGTPEAAAQPKTPPAIPAKYHVTNTSGLTADVQAGKKNEFKFDLTK